MSEQVSLWRPTPELQEEYRSFYQEWVDSGERMVPFVIARDPSNFGGMLEFLSESEYGQNLPEGLVPSSTFWLVTASRKVVGVVNIRHRLTENLYNSGGHIGYGIRPSERRNGYATKLLSLSLDVAKKMGLSEVLLICEQGNVGSERTIRKNGGAQDEGFVDANGKVMLRFWIGLSML